MSDDEHFANLAEAARSLLQWSRGAEERLKSLTENQATLAQAMARLAESQVQLSEAQANSEARIAALADAQADADFKHAALTDAQIRTETVMAELGEQMKVLAARQAGTDTRLDEFINTVRETREGNPPQQ